jgi:hypothetical protein
MSWLACFGQAVSFPHVIQMSGYSLPYIKFIVRHEHELRVHWHSLAALDYARRWLTGLAPADVPVKLADFPGDKRSPFTNVDISPAAYVGHSAGVASSISQRTLVQIVTVFETYIYDAFQRAVFLDPDLVKDSKVSFEASRLASAVRRSDVRAWFAHQMADRYSRSLTHGELISRLAKLAKSGVLQQHGDEYAEWQRWVLVRNSIVHLGGSVSTELAAAWPSKFASEQAPILLVDKDIIRAAHVSRLLSKNLDKRLVQEVIGDQDQALMAQEIFIRSGVSDPKKLSSAISKRSGANMKPSIAAKAIAAQKRGNAMVHGFMFIDEMLPVV